MPGGEVESPCLAAAVFEPATSTDSVTPARDVAVQEHVLREPRIIRQTRRSHNVQGPNRPARAQARPARLFLGQGTGLPADLSALMKDASDSQLRGALAVTAVAAFLLASRR